MSATILVCDSPEHAEIVDALVFARLQEVDGTQGARWSGIYTDGERFGIAWASPVSELFGDLAEEGLVVEGGEWEPWEPGAGDGD